MISLQYTVHYNYEGTLDESISKTLVHDDDFKNLIKETNINIYDVQYDDITIKKHSRLKSLISSSSPPSSSSSLSIKPSYALFRLDVNNSSNMILSTWVTSRCLEFLDAKDNLYEYIEKTSSLSCMPITKLLPYDTNTICELPSSPCLLKASLGSGGFGIYFVKNTNDVLSIIQWHMQRAEQTAGFIDGLKKDFGRVPLWSIQEFIPSVRYTITTTVTTLLTIMIMIRVQGNKRCQVRVYVVICEEHCYYYHTIEVRIPTWDRDELLDHSINDSDNHNDNDAGDLNSYDRLCCKGTEAIPYNLDRNKKETARYLISEVEEISSSSASEAVTECVVTAFLSLQPYIVDKIIEQNKIEDHIPNRTKLAIAGVDLVLKSKVDSSGFEALIVEVNNNPSMVQSSKKMSEKFNHHLKQLLSDIALLGLSNGKIQKNFSKIW